MLWCSGDPDAPENDKMAGAGREEAAVAGQDRNHGAQARLAPRDTTYTDRKTALAGRAGRGNRVNRTFLAVWTFRPFGACF